MVKALSLNKKVMLIFSNWRIIALVLLVTSLVLVSVSESILLIISVLLCALWLHNKLSIVFIFSLVLSILLYGIAGSLLMHIAYIVNIQMNLTGLYILLSLSILLLIFKSKSNPFKIRFAWSDAVHAIFIIISILILAWPMIGASPSKAVEFLRLGGGEDTSSQMQMYHYVLKEARFAYNNTSEDTGIRESLTSYPQGSHAVAVVLTQPFMFNIEDRQSLIVGYAMSLISMYVATFYLLFATVSRSLVDSRKKFTGLMAESVVAILVGAFGVLGLFLSLLTHGFMGQVAAYLGVMLVFTFLLLSGGFSSGDKSGSNLAISFLGLLLGFFLVFTSWYLIAPIAIIPCIAFVVANIKWIRDNLVYIMTSLVILGLTCVYLVYVYLFTSTDSGHILTPAGVDKLSICYFLITVPIFILGVLYFKRKRWVELTIVLSILASIAFAALIGVYQIKKIGHFEYYFFKSIYTFLVISLVLLMYEIANYLKLFVDSYRDSNLQLFGIFMTIAILVGASLSSMSKPAFDYFEMKYQVVETERKRLLDLTLENDNEYYADVLFIGACDEYLNFLGTIWSGTMVLGYLDNRNELESALLHDDESQIGRRLVEYAKDTDGKIKVYVIGECSPVLEGILSDQDKYVLNTSYRTIQP